MSFIFGLSLIRKQLKDKPKEYLRHPFALHYHLPTSYTAVVVGLRRNRRKIRHSCRRDGLDFENYCTI